MEFVSQGNILIIFSLFLIVAAVAMAPIIAASFVKDKDKSDKLVSIFGPVGAITIIVTGAIMVISGFNAKTERIETVAAQIYETYGIEIPKESIATKYKHDELVAGNLNYPFSEPEGNSVRYGTVVESKFEDDVMSERKITLAWVDGEFRLYGMDESEEVGPELPRVSD